MSLCTLSQVLDRVKIAPMWNGIAVFADDNKLRTRYNAVFANTVQSQKQIKSSPFFIGEFNSSHDLNEVSKILTEAYA